VLFISGFSVCSHSLLPLQNSFLEVSRWFVVVCDVSEIWQDQASYFNGLKINIRPYVKWNNKTQEEFEDTKGVIRQRSTRHTHKTKDRVTQTPQVLQIYHRHNKQN